MALAALNKKILITINNNRIVFLKLLIENFRSLI